MPCTVDARALEGLLRATYGAQSWWPAESLFEMMSGAVLVQNTRWENAEQALRNLDTAGLLVAPEILAEAPLSVLEDCVRSAGFYRAKSRTLQAMSTWICRTNALSATSEVHGWTTTKLRSSLLGVTGIGPETADVVSLFAFDRPVFVWSAYARRLLVSLGYDALAGLGYEACRKSNDVFVDMAGLDVGRAQELHALIVRNGKERRILQGIQG